MVCETRIYFQTELQCQFNDRFLFKKIPNSSTEKVIFRVGGYGENTEQC